MTRPFSKSRRRARADDSIIRGAAIIRDHINRLDVSNESEEPDRPLVSSRRRNLVYSSSFEEDDTSISDPWLKRGLSRCKSVNDKQPRPVSPVQKKEAIITGFDSITAGETFGSNGSQGDWAEQALNNSEDVSLCVSVRSSQPDTDPCPQVTPPNRPKTKTLKAAAKMTTRDRVASVISADQGDDDNKDNSNSYDFVDRYYAEEEEFDMRDYDEVVGQKSYLPKEMRTTLTPTISNKEKNSPLRILSFASSKQEIDAQRRRKYKGSDVATDVISPLSIEYYRLRQDPAYIHAQKAGHVWQSLVGCQIRFPSTWWNGARGPPMGLTGNQTWQFFGRYPSNNPNLRRYCKHRSAPGRLLLHIVVQDLVTWKPVQDIVVGCFDPNARGIRKTPQAQPGQDERRELWLAVRKRSESVSVIDSLLAQGRSWKDDESRSPLGPKQRVTNVNVRAVFGEEPPVESIFVHESTLYERLVSGRGREDPPLFLVREFVFC
ncbi:hypothetical protein ACA910_017183 [Epithemia clementina (nom. ined.)]